MTDRVTIKDIAKECGVSITSVSFVLNGRADAVSKETAERILNVCKRYNYHPSYLATALKSKTTHTVGVLIPDLENQYYSRILKCLENSLAKKGYSLFIASSGYNFDNFHQNIINMESKKIDSMVIVPPSSFSNINEIDFAAIEHSLHTKTVILDRTINLSESSIIINDDTKGGYLATKHLIEKGHRRIACITGPNGVSSSDDRLNGYKLALEENNIDFDYSLIYEADYRYEGAIAVAKKILSDNSITAIFAFNDLMAYAIYNVASECKKVVGKDISIVGFDDNQFSSLISPGLTTIKQNVESLCEHVIKELFNETTNTIIVEPNLVERSSVKDVNI